MVNKECLTIKEEMEALGIKPKYFNKLYEQLKVKQQLPPQIEVPAEQYQIIVNYLTQKEVLGKDGAIQEGELKLFDSRKQLEEMLEDLHNSEPRPRVGESSGGIVHCRSYGRSSGGIASCRY